MDHRRDQVVAEIVVAAVSRGVEAKLLEEESGGEDPDIGRAGKIRFVYRTHRCRGPFGQQRTNPLAGGRTHGVGTGRMQVIGERAGHEFYLGLRERP